MRRPKEFPAGSEEAIREELKRAKTKGEYRRLLCLSLRNKRKILAAELDELLRPRHGIIRQIQEEFAGEISSEMVEGIINQYLQNARKLSEGFPFVKYMPHAIADILELSVDRVRHIQAAFLTSGTTAAKAVLKSPARGGNHRSYLTPEEEKHFLDPYLIKAKTGQKVAVTEIQKAFEIKVGRAEVAVSTIYRLLNRHHWFDHAPRSSGGTAMFQLQKGRKTDGDK